MSGNFNFRLIWCTRVINIELHKFIYEVFPSIPQTASHVLKIDMGELIERNWAVPIFILNYNKAWFIRIRP